MVLLAVALFCLFVVAAANAADRVYWSEFSGRVSFVNLDGSGAEELRTVGGVFHSPQGDAIDPATGRIYWLNSGDNASVGAGISFASLDGSGGSLLPTPGAVFDEPQGLAIDPVGGRIYWADRAFGSSGIWSVKLDGSGAVKLDTSGATVAAPSGLAIDPGARRVYWVNDGGEPGKTTVSFAGLDGPGHAGDLPTPGAPEVEAEGLAIDPVGQRVYWANLSGDSISVARLDGSGGGKLNTAGATVSSPRGVAVDPFGGRLYWANDRLGNPVSFARLDGSGAGGDLSSAKTNGATFPLLQVAPRSAAAPVVSGSSKLGAVLSCSEGAWAPDLLQSFLYEAPQGFQYQWTRNGKSIPGATGKTFEADDPRGGDYGCQVTARNSRGETTRPSNPHHVAGTAFDAATGVSLKLLTSRLRAGAPVAVRLTNSNDFAVVGSLAGESRLGHRHLKLKAAKLRVGAHADAVVKLRPSKPLQRLLSSRHKLPLRLAARVKDQAGNSRKVTLGVVVRARP